MRWRRGCRLDASSSEHGDSNAVPNSVAHPDTDSNAYADASPANQLRHGGI